MTATSDPSAAETVVLENSELLGELRRAADDAKSSSDDIQVRANAILGFTAVVVSLTLGIDYPTILAHGDFGVPAIGILLATMLLGVLAVVLPQCESVDSHALIDSNGKVAVRAAVPMTILLDKYANLNHENAGKLSSKRLALNGAIVLLLIGIVLMVMSIVQSGVSYPGL